MPDRGLSDLPAGEHFGEYLRRAREASGVTLAALALTTRIREESLRLVEEARIEALPAEVFVRGFVRNYARAVGADADEAVRRYHRFLGGRRGWRSPSSGVRAGGGEAVAGWVRGRRRLVMVLLVLLLVVVATLTVSLLLRRSVLAGAASACAGSETRSAVAPDGPEPPRRAA